MVTIAFRNATRGQARTWFDTKTDVAPQGEQAISDLEGGPET